MQGVQAAHMRASMAGASMHASMPDGCGECDEEGKPLTPCSLLCAGFVAFAPMETDLQIIAAVFAYDFADANNVSLHGPPDPFPPKSLS